NHRFKRSAEAQRTYEDCPDQRAVATVQREILWMAMLSVGQCIKRRPGVDYRREQARCRLSRFQARLGLSYNGGALSGPAILAMLPVPAGRTHDHGPLRPLSQGPG